MINAVREWLLSLIVVTMVLSVVSILIPDGTVKRIAGLIGGILMILVLTMPVVQQVKVSFTEIYSDRQNALENWEAEIKELGEQTWSSEVEKRLEEYIETYAASKGIALQVEAAVSIREDGIPVPVSIEIYGETNHELAAWIAAELGISEEQQHWIAE